MEKKDTVRKDNEETESNVEAEGNEVNETDILKGFKKFVVNLKRRPDRLKTFKAQCPIDDVEVIYACDGKQLAELKSSRKAMKCWKENKLFKSMKFRYENIKKHAGASGCFFSHYRIMKRIVKENIPKAIIFEDDAIFSESFLNNFKASLSELPSDFHILYFGGRFNSDYSTNKKSKYKIISKHITQSLMPYTSEHDRGTFGYVISLKGAQLICKNIDYVINIETNKIYYPLDHWLFRIWSWHDIKIYNTHPLLCHSPCDAPDSDIG